MPRATATFRERDEPNAAVEAPDDGSAPALLLLPDARPEVGFGHLSRCLVVAEEWTRRTGLAFVEATVTAPHWLERCRRAGARLVDPGSVEPRAFDWTLVDGYEVERSARDRARTSQSLAAIDDHGSGGWAEEVDLLIDPNFGARATDKVRSLAGPRYALVGRDVLALAETKPRPRAVVIVGGGSPADFVLRWMDEVAHNLPEDIDVDVVRGARELPPAMAAAELVVTAAGTAALEALAMGRPVVAFTCADNQRPGAAHLAAAGVAVVGDIATTDPRKLAWTVAALLDDRDRLSELAWTCGSLVDGRGSRRVVSRLLGRLFRFRPAHVDDSELLWNWANDPDVRYHAFSKEPISWADHVHWLAAKLADPQTEIVVASWGGTPAGVVRFELQGGRAEISVALSGGFRGRGLGGPLLAAATDRYLERYPAVEVVEGRVLVDNAASRAAFLDADFDTDDVVHVRPVKHLRYHRRRISAGAAR